jgi:hypothetical protein
MRNDVIIRNSMELYSILTTTKITFFCPVRVASHKLFGIAEITPSRSNSRSELSIPTKVLAVALVQLVVAVRRRPAAAAEATTMAKRKTEIFIFLDFLFRRL